jgi:hypothetical protein
LGLLHFSTSFHIVSHSRVVSFIPFYKVFFAWIGGRERAFLIASIPLVRALRGKRFFFLQKSRAYIPKPKKPGQFRPITQPANRDRLVMDAMARLLSDELERIFLDVWVQNGQRGNNRARLAIDDCY